MHTCFRTALLVALLTSLSWAAASPGLAQPSRRRSARTPASYDYSRYSDGPRHVPRPRGRSQQRAERLALGTRDAARQLMREAPGDTWQAAAGEGQTRTLLWPVINGRYGRGFGFTRTERRDLRHNGMDIVAPRGSVVRAVADGIVAYSDNEIRGFGNCILILHPGGLLSLYAHNSRNTVQPGWRVQRGERIGFVGSTGIARGPHLHFELRRAGQLTDPAPLFVRMPRRGRELAPSEEEAELGPALALRLLHHAAPEHLREMAGERTFRNLLWPVRGAGVQERQRDRSLSIEAEEGSPVRAAADGIVIYAGRLPDLGLSIVLLHRSGWVTAYGSNGENHVETGQLVQRGEWIARVGRTASSRPRLRFRLIDAGSPRDPSDLLVGVPGPSSPPG